MLWQLYFWFIAALLVLPIPFKLAGYARGNDTSPAIVKVEETANAFFFSAGLFGLYGYVNNIALATPLIWRVWLAVAIIWSISGLVWSPKLKYAKEKIGTRPTAVLALVSSVLITPMLVAIYFYAAKT